MQGNVKDLWSHILGRIQEMVEPRQYETWFSPIRLTGIEGNTLLIRLPNPFFKEWFQNHYQGMLEAVLVDFLGSEASLSFVVNDNAEEEPNIELDIQTPVIEDVEKPKAPQRDVPRLKSESMLNPRFTFENFVVGRNNRLAHAAAFSVADSDKATYNPLFIHGGCGLGKTHLLHAIGHHARKARGTQRIFYVPCEEFTNQLILAIQTRTTNEFRNKYRKADFLLLDDIHFFSGKESSLEEFFHTFNTLYSAHKQIVLSSDRPPSEIPVMEERLISRFEWGLVADIQPPDLETRIAILQKRAEQLNCSVPEDVLALIAEKVPSNIRKLEGALTRVVAYASLNGGQMSFDLAVEILKATLPREEPKAPVTPELIQRGVAEYFDLRMADLKTHRRHRVFSYPRHLAMYLIRGMTKLSLPEIGEIFGGRDHSSVLYALSKTSKLAETDKKFQQDLSRIRSIIENLQQGS